MNTHCHIIKSVILLSIFFLFHTDTAYALHPIVRNFPRKEYKAGTQNWDIAQDNNGEMYFANNSGLLVFDGIRWNTYPIKNHTNVRSLHYDKKNNKIYAGAFNELGYYQYDPETRVMSYQSLKEKIAPSERNFTEIWNIHQLDDIIYFQGDHEVFEYNGDTILRYNFIHKIDVSGIVDRTLFIASQTDGIYSLSGKMFIKLPNSDIMKNQKVCAIIPYKDNTLFVTDFHGLYTFNGTQVKPENNEASEFIKKNQAFCATTNGKKIVYGTVASGVIIQELRNNTFSYINTHSGLQNNTVLSIKFDNIGNIWLGLDKGIDYILDNSPIRNLFDSPNNIYGSGYASFIKGNTLYLGTNQGLYTTSYPIKETPQPLQLELLMKSQVWSLTEIDGTLFCGNDQGAFIIKGKNIQRIAGTSGTWTFIELKQKPNYILGSSYSGLYILKKVNNNWQFSHYIKGFDQATGMIGEDKEGYIWLSHWINGIYRFKLNNALDSVVNIDLFDAKDGFATTQNNTFKRMEDNMIFSSENGFHIFDYEKNTIKPYERFNHLFGQHPHNTLRLYENDRNEIWSVSSRYIGVAIRDQTGHLLLDSTSFRPLLNKLIIGFESLNFVDDSHLLISTEDGFSWVNMRSVTPRLNGRGVYIKNIYAHTHDTDTILYNDNCSINETLKIPHRLNNLRFECAWPEFREDEAIQYRYKLENFEDNWSAPQPNATREYPMLRQGIYTLRVKAFNTYDSSVSETSITFEILAPWYSGTIAIIIYSIIFVILLYLVIRYIKLRSQKAAQAIKIQKDRELDEQKRIHLAEAQEKEREIVTLKNQQLEHDLRHKSQELSHTTMNLIRKNEIFLELISQLNKIQENVNSQTPPGRISKQIDHLMRQIQDNIEHDNDWHKFEENFDLVYENFLKQLGHDYPQLNINDKRLCAYLKMGLSSKEIAPLLNMSVRSVEMTRYRLRKKMGLERETNLASFLQKI